MLAVNYGFKVEEKEPARCGLMEHIHGWRVKMTKIRQRKVSAHGVLSHTC